MSIHKDAMKIGDRVQLEKGACILIEHDEDRQVWIVQMVKDNRTSELSVGFLETCEAIPDIPFCEIDMRPLLGRLVRATLEWGDIVGRVTEIKTIKSVVLGVKFELPTEITIDGDLVAARDIRKVVLENPR